MVYQDLHVHTRLSLCAKGTAIVADYIDKAKAMGVPVIAFTDHMWDASVPGASPWYQKQSYEHILAAKAEIPAQTDGLKILFGCETECDMHGTVGISREVASQLDILLVPNSHTHMKNFVMPAEYADDPPRHGAFLVRHFMDIMNSPVAEFITAIPHPFAAVACPTAMEVLNSISDKDLMDCCIAAKQNNIAMEINTSSCGRLTPEQIKVCPFIRLYTIAREVGNTFTIGSDAHDIHAMETLPKAQYVMDAAGITADMLLKV